MKKRLFLYTTLILFAGLLSFFTVSAYVTYQNNLRLAKDTVMEITQLYADLYTDETDLSSFVLMGNNTRVTVISSDGTVLADSHPLDVNVLENHSARPEIEAAASGVPAAYVRYSDTLGTDLIYYALKVDGPSSYVFIRTAIPVAEIETYLRQSLPILVLLLCLISVLCFFLARSMIRRVTVPLEHIQNKLHALAGGEYTFGDIPKSFEEINAITQGIDKVADRLQGSFYALRAEKSKLDYILNNIGDGLFVLDRSKRIVLINTSALDIFNATSGIVNKNLSYLSYDKTLSAATDDCVTQEKSALFDMPLHGRIYFVAVNRLPKTDLTMVVLSDVTESRESAQRREEFFANASHELKTPLTVIKGLNELTAMNSPDVTVQKYADGIARETNRMLSLIEDMLKLSELENTQEIQLTQVSLAAVAHEICETLSTDIDQKKLHLQITGDANVEAAENHLYDLVKNLVENAVRYTGENGNISIRMSEDQGVSQLVIADNGIGISPDEQTRIFERFYRVEKSRSQRNGGTGLGLAIVKHICVIYHWNLSLKSKQGTGTEVTILFCKPH